MDKGIIYNNKYPIFQYDDGIGYVYMTFHHIYVHETAVRTYSKLISRDESRISISHHVFFSKNEKIK